MRVGGSGAGRWLLLLALAAGLIGMHHLEASGAYLTGPATTGPAMTGPAMTGPAMTGPAMTGPAMTGAAMTGPAMTGAAMTGAVAAAPSDHPAAVSVHDPDMPGMAMTMHMCLAVLGAALLLGLLLLLVVTVLARRPAPAAPRAVALTAVRPPPRSAVRLALLCVLRN